jgi:hypothetical protein
MLLDASLTMDVTGCTFAFSDWNMGMDSPSGGSVTGTTATFAGSSHWESCEGEIDGSNGVSALCTDDSTSFTMQPM